MEAYATKQDTVDALVTLGFIPFEDEDGRQYLDSAKETDTGSPYVQLYVYQCSNKYWCVDANGILNSGFDAPVVWKGPRADWDKAVELDEFVEWLDQYNPGWR